MDGRDSAGMAIEAAARLGQMNSASLAGLRRMPAGHAAAGFWPLGLPERAEWMVIARLLAILTDRGSPARRAVLHDSTRPLGQALCDGGRDEWTGRDWPLISEERLALLLLTRGPARHALMIRAATALARAHGPGLRLDVTDIAQAILEPGETRRIAETYYRRLDRVTGTAEEEYS